MRVRADQKFRTYVNGALLRASEGSVWEGAAARAMLATRCPVTVLEADPEPEDVSEVEAPEVDEDPQEEPSDEPTEESEGVPDGNVSDILDWVGDDKDRAREALDVERGKERPRASLVKQLNTIAE